MNKIEVKDLYKSFREYQVLRGINCCFEEGKIYGLIGRNGCGKTVLLKCICGFLVPDKGEIRINGMKRKKGELLEEAGIRNKMDREKLKNIMKEVGLDADDKKAVSKYSLGMRQRLAIAQALMEDPQILILDEPMNGLDEKGAKEVRGLLMELRSAGKLVILASHNKDDIEVLCDRVYKMEDGKLAFVK